MKKLKIWIISNRQEIVRELEKLCKDDFIFFSHENILMLFMAHAMGNVFCQMMMQISVLKMLYMSIFHYIFHFLFLLLSTLT